MTAGWQSWAGYGRAKLFLTFRYVSVYERFYGVRSGGQAGGGTSDPFRYIQYPKQSEWWT